ncbi:hypothetical protein OFM13_34045, partial [Escherichia coli]|nr:hypothetical protein [Escherichia coli]
MNPDRIKALMGDATGAGQYAEYQRTRQLAASAPQRQAQIDAGATPGAPPLNLTPGAMTGGARSLGGLIGATAIT